MIIFWKNTKGLYAWLQWKFSGKRYSHTAIYLGKLLGKDWVYEAGLSLSANPVNLNDTEHIEIWETSLNLEPALSKVIDRVNGKSYAFLQILYFIRRKFYESKLGSYVFSLRAKITGTDKVTKIGNWFPRSMICTEFVAEVLKEANEKINKYITENYDSNNLYVSDVLNILQQFPQYFNNVRRK